MSEPRVTKRERRELRREDQRGRAISERRSNRRNRALGIAIAAILVVLGVALAWGPISNLFGANKVQAVSFANQGQEHITPDKAPITTYNSNPPTSGPHFGDAAAWGTYDRILPDETLVHNLEHGGIVIGYNCAAACPELVEQLKGVATQYRTKVVLAPRPNKDVASRITLTAWTKLDQFNDFDADRIKAFISAFKDKGPEFIPE